MQNDKGANYCRGKTSRFYRVSLSRVIYPVRDTLIKACKLRHFFFPLMKFTLIALHFLFCSCMATSSPWTMTELGRVPIPEDVSIAEILREFSNNRHVRNPIGILNNPEYSFVQKKSIIVHVMESIQNGIVSGDASGFQIVVDFLEKHHEDRKSFILACSESIDTAIRNGKYKGFKYAIRILDNELDTYEFTKSIIEGIKTDVLAGNVMLISMVLRSIPNQDHLDEIIFAVIDSIPSAKDSKLYPIAVISILLTYLRDQSLKTKFIFGLTEITNVDVSDGLTTRFPMLFRDLASAEERVEFAIGLLPGMMIALPKGNYQGFKSALDKHKCSNRYESCYITDDPDNLVKLISGLEKVITAGISMGNAELLFDALRHLPNQQLKTWLILSQLESIKSALKNGHLYPFRFALENSHGRILQDALIEKFEKSEIGAIKDSPENLQLVNYLDSLEKELAVDIAKLNEADRYGVSLTNPWEFKYQPEAEKVISGPGNDQKEWLELGQMSLGTRAFEVLQYSQSKWIWRLERLNARIKASFQSAAKTE
jgi:hypothetical protein